MKLKIKVTQEILFKSRNCPSECAIAIRNCAIALAIRDVFPNAYVNYNVINPLGTPRCENIALPKIAYDFIEKFDDATPKERVEMPEIEFEIDIPDEVIEKINIDEIRPLLENHPTLELVDAT